MFSKKRKRRRKTYCLVLFCYKILTFNKYNISWQGDLDENALVVQADKTYNIAHYGNKKNKKRRSRKKNVAKRASQILKASPAGLIRHFSQLDMKTTT